MENLAFSKDSIMGSALEMKKKKKSLIRKNSLKKRGKGVDECRG